MSYLNPWLYFQIVWVMLFWSNNPDRNNIAQIIWPSWLLLSLCLVFWAIVVIIILRDNLARGTTPRVHYRKLLVKAPDIGFVYLSIVALIVSISVLYPLILIVLFLSVPSNSGTLSSQTSYFYQLLVALVISIISAAFAVAVRIFKMKQLYEYFESFFKETDGKAVTFFKKTIFKNKFIVMLCITNLRQRSQTTSLLITRRPSWSPRRRSASLRRSRTRSSKEQSTVRTSLSSWITRHRRMVPRIRTRVRTGPW